MADAGLIVCKFGGTSLADASQISKVLSILKADPRRRIVVPSAPGKRSPTDTKITDHLYRCHQLRTNDPSVPFGEIRERFLDLGKALGAQLDLDGLLSDVLDRITESDNPDFVASRGEYICGRLLADLLGATFVDPADDAILFDGSGRLDPQTYERLGEKLSGSGMLVVPGFYGADPNGCVRTFPRGGSDITGAVVARAARAAVYENWTDVSGLRMADPRIVPEARLVEEITYREIRELSYMGATVFNDEAMFPVREASIPVNIRNTNRPEDPGTMVVAERTPVERIAGVAGRTRFSMLFLEKAMMNTEKGFGLKVFQIIADHDISYEHTPTGIDTMSVILRDEELADRGDQLMESIRRDLGVDRVELVRDLALIATVGLGMSRQVGMASRLFLALADAGVNVRVIDQGSSEINIIVGVEAKDYEAAVRAIYHAFID